MSNRHRSRLLQVGVFWALAAFNAVEAGGDVDFSKPPQISRAGKGVKITFAVSAPTDVEVAVLDADGRVVRHLAAGVLGGDNPPPAPLKAGLAQELAWDGKDDLGVETAAAALSGFQVRIRLALGARLDGVFCENKNYFAALWGLATDPAGRVYVYSSSVGNGGPGASHHLQVFDRAGRYLRTLMPMPADLPKAKVKPFKVVPVPGKHIYPRNRWGTWPVLYPDLFINQTLAARVGEDGLVHIGDGRRVARIGPDGGAADAAFAREIWPKNQRPSPAMDRYFMAYPGHLTRCPDGRYVYLTGVYQTKPVGKQPVRFPPGRVYRMRTDGGYMELFAQVKPAGEGRVNLAGAAFDAEGNLLVCDRAGGRIVVISPEGKQVGSIAVASPVYVSCHRKTGAVYVLSIRKTGYFRSAKSLTKFSGWKPGSKQVAQLRLRAEGYRAVMALDDATEPPVLWVGIDRSKRSYAWRLEKGARILRLEDRGSKFAETAHGIKFGDNPVRVVTRLAVHPETDTVICRGEYAAAAGFDGTTGKRIKLPFTHCTDMGVGLDGNWYVQTQQHWSGPICRYDKALKPIPVTGRGDGKNSKLPANAVGSVVGRWGSGFGTGGLTATGHGRIFSVQQVDHQTISGDCVPVFSPNGVAEDPGRMKDDPRIAKHGVFPSVWFGPIAAYVGGIGADYTGHIYLGVQALPMNHRPPPGFEKDPAYRTVVGSVVKIGPEGGSLIDLGGKGSRPPRKARTVPADMQGLKLIRRGGYPAGAKFVENAVRAYPGLGSVSGSFGTGCRCRQPMFQVDGWGRIFIPNAITYSVAVVDNEGNLILRFGHYGNVDSAGPGSPIPTPEIPLGWPEAVAVSRRAIYVADVLNRRIVRVRKTYARELTLPVK